MLTKKFTINHYFNQLILNKIYINLSLNDLRSCSLVNKKFNKAFDHDVLWIFLFNKHYKNIDLFKKNYCPGKIISSKIIYKKYRDLLPMKKILKTKEHIDSIAVLSCLNLSNKKLTILPKEIGSLINLRYLHLYDNKLIQYLKK